VEEGEEEEPPASGRWRPEGEALLLKEGGTTPVGGDASADCNADRTGFESFVGDAAEAPAVGLKVSDGPEGAAEPKGPLSSDRKVTRFI